MATEELKLKIVVDTSAISSGVNQAKKKLEGVETGMGKTAGNAKETTKQTEKLRDSIQAITNIKIGENLISNMEGITKSIGSAAAKFREFGNAFMSWFDRDWLEALKDDFKRGGFKGAFKGLKDYTTDAFDDTKSILYEGIENIGDATSRMLGKSQEAVEGVGEAGGKASAIISVLMILITAVIAAITGLVKNALNMSKLAKETLVLSQRSGMAVKDYQAWGYVLENCGVEANELSEIISTLTEAQIDVISGTEEMTQAFRALGISEEQVKNLSQEELFGKTIERLQQIDDKTQRASIAYKIFGEDASKLSTILNLSNQETKDLLQTYDALGGTMSDSLIEKSNSLQTAILNLKTAWQGMKNILAEWVIPAIQSFVESITRALVWITAIVKVLFNLGSSGKAGTDGAKVGMDNYKASIEGATGAANELKRTVMGFDELNIVSNPNKNSGGAGGGSGTGYFGSINASDLSSYLDFNSEYLEIQEKVEKYKTAIQDIATWGLLGIGILLCIIGLFTGGLASPAFWTGVGLAHLGISVGMGEDSTFSRLGETIKKWWKKYKPWLEENVFKIFTKKFWEELWNNIKTAAGTKLEELKTKIGEKWDAIKTWYDTTIAPKFTVEYWKDKFETIREGAKQKLDEVKTALDEKWKAIKKWFNDNIAPKFTIDYWKEKFGSIKDGAKQKLDEVKTALNEKWEAIKKWFNDNVAPKFTWTYWYEKAGTIKNGIAQAIQDAKEKISEKWEGVKSWFNTNVAPKFTYTYWYNKFISIKNGAKDAFNSVISVVETAINNIIKKINTLAWTIPDWVPGYGGEKWGFNFNTVSIPRLAQGGITNGSVLANIGENGREAVLPLENNTGWMDVLADRIAARSQQRVVLQVGEKELGWATIGAINGITKQTGGLQLAL